MIFSSAASCDSYCQYTSTPSAELGSAATEITPG